MSMGHNAYRDNMYTKEKIIHIRKLLDDTIEQANVNTITYLGPTRILESI